MDNNAQTTYVRELPGCDLHNAYGVEVQAEYDAKTRMGPWAALCAECFVRYGVGLGLGRGQRLLIRDAGNGPGPPTGAADSR